MIRPFGWRDVSLVRNLGPQGVSFHSQETLTRGVSVLQDALRGYLAPRSRKSTFVWRTNGDQRQRAFAQLQVAPHEGRARVRYLAPAGADRPAMPGVKLIERLAFEAGARGNHYLVAEVDEASPEFDLLRTAGFAVYTRQEIFCRALAGQPAGPTLPLRARRDVDTLGVQLLYNNIVPRLVQQVEPSPATSAGGYVFTENSEILAYLDVRRGPRGVWMQPFLHPDSHAVMDAVMVSFLSLETAPGQKPVYVCVRSYQHGLHAALAANGFRRAGQQAVMVKRLVAPIGAAKFKALPTIDGTEREIAAPITKAPFAGRRTRG
ncbi:MAG: hypothetical protein ACE5FI_15610 [Anaerolineales bacterium]